jgi:hypothetical protein
MPEKAYSVVVIGPTLALRRDEPAQPDAFQLPAVAVPVPPVLASLTVTPAAVTTLPS